MGIDLGTCDRGNYVSQRAFCPQSTASVPCFRIYTVRIRVAAAALWLPVIAATSPLLKRNGRILITRPRSDLRRQRCSRCLPKQRRFGKARSAVGLLAILAR